jgi:hypothetical protein
VRVSACEGHNEKLVMSNVAKYLKLLQCTHGCAAAAVDYPYFIRTPAAFSPHLYSASRQ